MDVAGLLRRVAAAAGAADRSGNVNAAIAVNVAAAGRTTVASSGGARARPARPDGQASGGSTTESGRRTPT